MAEPTINDLHVLLVEMKGEQKVILSEVKHIAAWKEKHEADDAVKHEALHKRISSIKNYGFGIGLVAMLIGGFFGIEVEK